MVDLGRQHHRPRVVTRAVRRGLLVRQPCERCGNPKSVGHHDDYSNPLDVRWLCQPCHIRLHHERGELGHRIKKFVEVMTVGYPPGTFDRIDAVLAPTEDRAEFVRAAVEDALRRREAERPVRKTAMRKRA